MWCANPSSLNDDDEFKFKLNYDPSPRTADLLSQVVAKFRTTNLLPPHLSVPLILQNGLLEEITAPIINEIVIQKCRDTIGIASFSVTKADDHLWTEYGGKGNGVCVEIDIPDKSIGISFHPVHYVSEKIFHVDTFLESALFPDKGIENYRNILLTKTRKWSREEEIRFVSKHPEVNVIIVGRITGITLGAHVPAHTIEQVEVNIVDHCIANNITITKL